MQTNIESYLEQLVDGQKKQAERDGVVLREVSEIKKRVERLHERLDDIHETTVIHGEKIKYLNSQQCKQDENCKSQHELIWLKIRERKEEAISEATQKVKLWVLTGALSGAVAFVFSIISMFFKKGT